jgi:hypothetical protein
MFTGRFIETTVLLLLPVLVAARMFKDIPPLLEKQPICHNILLLNLDLIDPTIYSCKHILLA